MTCGLWLVILATSQMTCAVQGVTYNGNPKISSSISSFSTHSSQLPVWWIQILSLLEYIFPVWASLPESSWPALVSIVTFKPTGNDVVRIQGWRTLFMIGMISNHLRVCNGFGVTPAYFKMLCTFSDLIYMIMLAWPWCPLLPTTKQTGTIFALLDHLCQSSVALDILQHL